MKKRIILATLAILCVNVNSRAQTNDSPKVEIRNIQTSYKWFSDLNPSIANETGRTIYSFNLPWGLQLMRLNEATGNWEKGMYGSRCLRTSRSAEATISKTLGSYLSVPVSVNWGVARGLTEQPGESFFRLEGGEERPLAGRYKLLFNYAYEPWERREKPPSAPLSVTSSAFSIIP